MQASKPAYKEKSEATIGQRKKPNLHQWLVTCVYISLRAKGTDAFESTLYYKGAGSSWLCHEAVKKFEDRP